MPFQVKNSFFFLGGGIAPPRPVPGGTGYPLSTPRPHQAFWIHPASFQNSSQICATGEHSSLYSSVAAPIITHGLLCVCDGSLLWMLMWHLKKKRRKWLKIIVFTVSQRTLISTDRLQGGLLVVSLLAKLLKISQTNSQDFVDKKTVDRVVSVVKIRLVLSFFNVAN